MSGGYTWDMLLDPNNFLLIFIASTTILYGSYRSNDFFANFRETLELDNNVVKTRTAIIMPIVGSIFLVLLFFFLNWIYYLLVAIMAFSSLSSFAYFAYPFLDALCNRIGGTLTKSCEVRWLGWISVSGIASLLVSLAMVISWLVTLNFVLTDILAISLALTALSFVRLPNLKVAAIILVLFFFYDIFWVFISPFIFKKSVMVTVAVQLPSLPMVIVIPRFLNAGWSLLGVGDIVLPGLWLCFLFRFDKLNKTTFLNGYFLRAWIGYILGLVLTLCMLLALQQGQPALLYLVPFTLIPPIFFGWMRNELKQLWTGIIGDEESTPQATQDSGVSEDEVSLLHASEQGDKQV